MLSSKCASKRRNFTVGFQNRWNEESATVFQLSSHAGIYQYH